MNLNFMLPIFAFFLLSLTFDDTYAQIQNGGFGDSPFERDFGDVKFLDAYFGTLDKKIEIESGDKNVPFTVVFANVGSQDITGIRGQLLLPFGFSPSDGLGTMIRADSDSNSSAGEHFHLTFFVNIEKNIEIQQYPATVKLDYSRLRESGIRTSFTDFDFKVTGDSIINVKAVNPFLTSLKFNNIKIEISNDGTAPISNVDIIVKNTQTTTTSTTNIENVIILESNWDIGNIEPKSLQTFPVTVYVPENEIPKLIGVKGKRISNIEEKLGIRITVKELEIKKEPTNYNVDESKKFVTFTLPKSQSKKHAEVLLEDNFLFSAVVSNSGKIQIHKKSQLGRTLMEALDTNKKLEVKI